MSAYSKLLIGRGPFETGSEYKFAMLRGQIGFLLGVLCLFYFFFDTFHEVYIFYPLQITGFSAAIAIIYLNRSKKYYASSILILLVFNFLVFLFAVTGPQSKGVYFFFITTSSFALILFYPEKKVTAFSYMGLSWVLSLIAFFGEFSFIPIPQQSAEIRTINFIINMTIGFASTMGIIIFSINRYQQSMATLSTTNKELLKVNKELDQFVYRASHDMRSPLSTMAGIMNLLRLSKNQDETNQYFAMIENRIEAMNGFIKDITNYAMNTKISPKMSRINFYDFAGEIIKSLQIQAQRLQVMMDMEVDSGLYLVTDEVKLKIILNNLLTNAIKYHAKHKEDRIVRLKAQMNGTMFKIEVQDNGDGIPEKFHNNIFDMFFRASTKSDGSGLGLYIAKEAVEQLNGTISLKSDLNEGTSFVVLLPGNQDSHLHVT